MKFESAGPESEQQGNEQIDCDVDIDVGMAVTNAGKARNYHDIRASLAIINGYSNALESSFQELKSEYSNVPTDKDGCVSDSASGDRLMTLEADCRFCLSRLSSSIAQLKESLKLNGVLRDSSQD